MCRGPKKVLDIRSPRPALSAAMTTTRQVGDVTFRPGLYRHTKSGGLYTALGIVRHHETGYPMVLYYSHAHATLSVRPLYGYTGPRCADPDGFADRFELVTDGPDPAAHPSDLPEGVAAVELWRSHTLLRNFSLVDAALVGVTDPELDTGDARIVVTRPPEGAAGT
jgi:hypothetical protein